MPLRDRTIDHILPVCMGGGSTLDNLKLAHGYCNSFRSAQAHLTAEQLIHRMTKAKEAQRYRTQRAQLRAMWKKKYIKNEDRESA
jgi:5-methylcytosine-specific restriction endonuclease McrA